MDIQHVVVLMLENRSFDCMLGTLYPSNATFDGLTGTETNPWHKPDGTTQTIGVWNDPTLTAQSLCIPDPDPGESFTDMAMQIDGMSPGAPPMSGFVDNYMNQPATTPATDPRAVMHYFTPAQVPVISQLARAFGVSDRWHASAPCQTWPNRFFVHTGTANGYVNNRPTHFPYDMKTVFNGLSEIGQSWRIYFHDTPQAAALSRLWGAALTGHFLDFTKEFARDAALGGLPAYSFIEPRYFADTVLNEIPNDEHPPHNVAYGEQLIATVYNAVRNGPAWKQTLLIVTYDEHGGCYDHVPPPAATPPDDDGTGAFDRFGVRVPAVIVSPYVPAGSVIRPAGSRPFDHTSIIATLRRLFGIAPLTARDAAAPDLIAALESLGDLPENDGPAKLIAPAIPSAPEDVARIAAAPPNDLQKSLTSAALRLPAFGADLGAHIHHLRTARNADPQHASVAEAVAEVVRHVGAFLRRI